MAELQTVLYSLYVNYVGYAITSSVPYCSALFMLNRPICNRALDGAHVQNTAATKILYQVASIR